MDELNINNNNNDSKGGAQDEDEEEKQTNDNNKKPNNTIRTATVDTSTIPLDWTKLGQTTNETEQEDVAIMPVRLLEEVIEWSNEELEIYSVGTAGQKITTMGDTGILGNPDKTNPKLHTLVLRSHLIKYMDGITSGLSKLNHIQLLELYDNMIQELDGTCMKPSLQTLDMSYNAIRDMTPVSQCINLTELYLANNKLKQISGLSSLTKLKKLDLGANRIRIMDPTELDGLINLEELWIGKNKIEQIDGLYKLKKLRRLDIQSNRLTKIEHLDCICDTLEELYLAHNGIDDDGAFQGLMACQFPNLNVLDLSRNQLSNTKPFVHLDACEELWLSGNQMIDFDAILPLKEACQQGQLSNLQTIYLEYNPLASDFEYRKKIKEWIPTLQQIDATMIGGINPQGIRPSIAVPAITSSTNPPIVDTEERLRQLQEAAIQRAKQETMGKGGHPGDVDKR